MNKTDPALIKDTAPFNLAKALAGHPLITRCGDKVTNFRSRYVDQPDYTGNYPYFGTLPNGALYSFTAEGYYLESDPKGANALLLDTSTQEKAPLPKATDTGDFAPKNLSDWKEVHYKEPVVLDCTDKQLVEMSLTKWKGLRPEVLKEYNLEQYTAGPHRGIKDRSLHGAGMTQSSVNCPLCKRFLNKPKHCAGCPLYEVRGKVACDDKTQLETQSPFCYWGTAGDPEPMIWWLERAKEYAQAQQSIKELGFAHKKRRDELSVAKTQLNDALRKLNSIRSIVKS